MAPLRNNQYNVGSNSIGTGQGGLSLDIQVPDTVIRESSIEVVFLWARRVDGFRQADIALAWYTAGGIYTEDRVGSLEDIGTVDGQQRFQATLHFPEDAVGSVDIFVFENAATETADATVQGPSADVSRTVTFNTLRSVTTPTVVITVPPTTVHKSDGFTTRFTFSEPVGGFVVEDADTPERVDIEISATAGTPTIDNLQNTDTKQLGEIYTADVHYPANTQGTLTLSVKADSVQGKDALGPAEKTTVTWDFDSRTEQNRTVTGGTLIGTHTKSLSDADAGVYNGVPEIASDGTYTYEVVQVMKTLSAKPNNFADSHTQAGWELIRTSASGGSRVVIQSGDNFTTAPCALCFHKGVLHWFRGSAYAEAYNDDVDTIVIAPTDAYRANYRQRQYTWKEEMGVVYKLSGTMPVFVGQMPRSQFVNPDAAEAPQDTRYGIPIGTHSPMLSTPLYGSEDKLHVVAGYGKLSEILDIDAEVSDIENFNWVAIGERLLGRLPMLNTNGMTGWAVLEAIALSLHARIGFNGDSFEFKPAMPFQTSLAAAITAADTSATFSEANTFGAINGLFLVGSELIEIDGTTLTRGLHGSTATSHGSGARLLKIDKYVSLDNQNLQQPINSISFANARDRLFNVIEVRYGDGKTKEARDTTSISLHGEILLPVETLLGNHQDRHAEWLAGDYLARFSVLQKSATLRMLYSPFIEVGQILFIEIDAPRGFRGAVEVTEFTHLDSQITEILVVTV